MDFILAALGNKPTFSYLQVSVKTYWEQMAWLGPENWGAIPLRVPVPPPAPGADEEGAVDLTEGEEEGERGYASPAGRSSVLGGSLMAVVHFFDGVSTHRYPPTTYYTPFERLLVVMLL